MLVDANLLVYAVDTESPFHEKAVAFMEDVLNGARRVGFPWQALTAFVRICTHPRALETPLDPVEAWAFVDDWLSCDLSWTPVPTRRHAEVLGGLVRTYRLRGNLVSDAHLAALAVEHGLTVCSADTDFARFAEITWWNPLAG